MEQHQEEEKHEIEEEEITTQINQRSNSLNVELGDVSHLQDLIVSDTYNQLPDREEVQQDGFTSSVRNNQQMETDERETEYKLNENRHRNSVENLMNQSDQEMQRIMHDSMDQDQNKILPTKRKSIVRLQQPTAKPYIQQVDTRRSLYFDTPDAQSIQSNQNQISEPPNKKQRINMLRELFMLFLKSYESQL